jgi:hypothetical protein
MVHRVFRRVLFVLLLLSALAHGASDALVIRNSNLRADPSSARPPIGHLKQNAIVRLLNDQPQDGYYSVGAPNGESGWIYSKNLRIQQPQGSGGVLVSSTLAAVSDVISEQWEKPEPNQTHFTTQAGLDCGPAGTGADTITNTRKDRTDESAGGYHDVSWRAIAALPYPDDHHKELTSWSPANRAEIEKYQGVAVRVVGYIKKIRPQTGNSESTNCGATAARDTDWHIEFVEHAHDDETTAIVIETTPRIKVHHPKWTPQRLAPWVDSDLPVRVSGWVLFDPEHRNHLNRYRSTLWEVHPIMKFEVKKGDAWVDVDDLP